MTSLPASVLELADSHSRSIGSAQLQSASLGTGAPGGIVHGPVKLSKGPIRTKEDALRRKMEKDGFDPNLHKRFKTHHEAVEYRRRNGIAQMTAQEYEGEFRNAAQSLVSHPAGSGGGMISSHKSFAVDWGSLPPGFTRESVIRNMMRGTGDGPKIPGM